MSRDASASVHSAPLLLVDKPLSRAAQPQTRGYCKPSMQRANATVSDACEGKVRLYREQDSLQSFFGRLGSVKADLDR